MGLEPEGKSAAAPATASAASAAAGSSKAPEPAKTPTHKSPEDEEEDHFNKKETELFGGEDDDVDLESKIPYVFLLCCGVTIPLTFWCCVVL
jgi:hypothetical protein